MYTDLLTQIKNAQAVKKEAIKIAFSNTDFIIAELLVKHDYLKEATKKGRMPKRVIEIILKYKDGKGVINGIKFISKPSRKIYMGYREIRPIKQGYGLRIISTSKGIMTDKEAKKMKLGGEVLFDIW
jgi:small subunit ribosomal protein S8